MGALVCVIDGDVAVRDSLATLIRLSGHEVQTFATGSAFLHAQTSFGCVVCEASLPDTTGVEVFKALIGADICVPFALLLSRHDPAVLGAAQRAGIRYVFPKPIVHRRLIAFVTNAVKAGTPEDPHGSA